MKEPMLLEPIQTSSVYMLKYPQTRRQIHLINEESQKIGHFIQPCVHAMKWTKTHFCLQTKRPMLLKPIQTSSVYMPKYLQTRMEHPIHLVHEELQYIWQFHPAMWPCGRQTKTHFQLQTKGPRLLKPINASSLCMPKCPQTRIELPIHVVPEELQ